MGGCSESYADDQDVGGWVVGCGCVRLSMGADVCGWLGVDVLVCVRTCVSGWVWVCSFVCVDAPQVGSPYEWH